MFISELLGSVVQVLIFAVIPFIVWLIAGRKKENFLKWLGIKKPEAEKPALKWWGIAIGVMAVYFVVSLLIMKYVFSDLPNATSDTFGGKGAAAIPAILVYSFIRTAFSEEMLFRGFILKGLSGKIGLTAANAVQALLFGAMHGVPIFVKTHNAAALILLTVLPACVGWVLGWLDEKKNGGSIIPSWILHGTINVFTALMSI